MANVRHTLEAERGYECYETKVGGGGVAFAYPAAGTATATVADVGVHDLPSDPTGFLTAPVHQFETGVEWQFY